MLFTERGRVNKLIEVSDNPDIDIKQIALDILRDLYSASRKLTMYPMEHPLTSETLKKPLAYFNEIFRYKHSFVIRTYNKRLTAEGLLLDDSVFVGGMLHDLKRHNIDSISFKYDLTPGDLYYLLSKLIEPHSPTEGYIRKFLKSKNITSIAINDRHAKTIYNFEETVIGPKENNFMLNDRIRELLLYSQDAIIKFYRNEILDDNDLEEIINVDFRLNVIKSYFAKVVSEMEEEQALEIFQMAIFSTDWLDENIADEKLNGLRQLWKDYSSKSEDVAILLPVYNLFKSVGATNEILARTFDRGALIKLKAVQDAEDFIEYLRTHKAVKIDFHGLRKTIFKLATESYSSPLEKLLKQLLKSISANDLDTRQRSLRLSIEALKTLADGSFWEIRDLFIREILRAAHAAAVGYEIVELVGSLIESAIELNRWVEMKICCQTLRAMSSDRSDFKNKKALAQLDDIIESSVMTDILIDAVITGKGDIELHEALAALRSPNVSIAILDKIDYEDKPVRARVIKALVAMGKAAGADVTTRLAELVGAGDTKDDGTWYKLRNLMRVLGQIQYIEALPYFEVMAGWSQKRLKHEIITACEDMKSSATGVVLSKLAVDQSEEIRRAAVVALGMSGNPDMIKFIRNLLYDPRSEKVTLIESLGRIGGIQARNILIDLYEDEQYYDNLDITKKEQEQIKLAILKALSKIGDDVSTSKIQLYGSKNRGGFFKKDVLSQTATILLDELKKKS